MIHSTPGTLEIRARVHLPGARTLFVLSSSALPKTIPPRSSFSCPLPSHLRREFFNSPLVFVFFFYPFHPLSSSNVLWMAESFSLPLLLCPSPWQSPSRALSISLSSSSPRFEGPRRVSLSVSRAKRFRGDVPLHTIDCGWSGSPLRVFLCVVYLSFPSCQPSFHSFDSTG